MSSVLQPWVEEMPWKMQSVLLTATRGPDNHRYKHIKIVNRWIRSQVFYDADPNNPFIAHPDNIPIDNHGLVDALEHELEYVTVHYFGHFIHALEIIGYKHPDHDTARLSITLYYTMCARILHLPPEMARNFDLRLADVTKHA